MTTIAPGAVDVSDCVCSEGYYMTTDADGTRDCKACSKADDTCNEGDQCENEPAKGSNCNVSGVTLEALPVRPQYWRERPGAQNVRKCFTGSACLGGTSTGEDVATFCAEGHHGPYCDVCLTGYFGGGQGKACVICEGDSNLAMLYYIGGFLAVALALAIFICRGGRGALKQIVGVVGKAQGGKNAGAALANAAKAVLRGSVGARVGPGFE